MENLIFYSPELSRESQQEDPKSMKQALALLKNPAVQREIESGNLTVAMIRPGVGPEANLLNLPDQEAADQIERMIEGLGMMAKFSIQFSSEIATEFYSGGPQASMLKEAPIDPKAYPSRWPEFIDFMSSAPTTVLLLHSPDGDAVEKWRSHLGHWNIDEVRDPETIRGRFGVNKYNNLVHGSDSADSALREIDIISRQLEASITKAHVHDQLTSFRQDLSERQWLQEIGILDSGAPYVIIPHSDWQRVGGETYTLDFTVATASQQTRLIAKACVKMASGEVMKEWLGRRQLLAENGLITPKLYAAEGATLLEEYIPLSFKEAYAQADEHGRAKLRNEFVEAFFTLHDLGFKPISLHDLRSHGNDVVFIDFGSDLGGRTTSTRSNIIEEAAKALTEAVNGL